MSIAIGTYIPITSSVNNVLSNKKIFAGVALTSNALIPTTNPLLRFTSSAAVSAYFGDNSNEYKSSVKYFSSYTGATGIPAYIYFGRFVMSASAPYLRSGIITNTTTKLTALQAISAGVMSVTVNGTSYNTTGIDLSGATSLSNVATLLTTAITTANAALNSSGANFTITYDSVFKQFVASIPGTGATKTMGYFSSASTNLATILQFTEATSAVLSQGENAQTEADILNNLSQYFTDQFSFYFVDDLNGSLNDDINLATATWISDQGDKFAFLLWSNESALESSTDTTSIWSQVKDAGLNNISIFDEVLLNNSDRAAAASGVFASLDLTLPNSAITLAFKQQTGLSPSVSNTNIAEILDDKKINYYGNVGLTGTTQQINFFYGGYITGKWSFIDNLVGQIWLATQCQISLTNLFAAVGQVPNDPDGQAQIRSLLNDACNSCLISGIIVKGVTFTQATVQQIKTEFGVNAQELTNNGFVIVNTLATQDLRQERKSSPWFILYVKGSAIQYLPINTQTFY